MFFALGFLIMGLLGLAFLPVYWRRAERMAAQRLQARLPMTIDEIVSERDALRAETAAKIRLMEIKSNAVRADHARDQVELGRRAAEIERQLTALNAARRDNAELEQQLAAAARASAQAEAGLSAALVEAHDATGLANRHRNAHAELLEAHRSLQSVADGRRAAIAALETRLSGLEMSLEDRARDLAQAVAQHASQLEETRRLQQLGEGFLAEREEVRRSLARLQARHDNTLTRLQQLDAQFNETRAALAEARDGVASQSDRAAAAEQALAQALQRESELRAQNQRQMEASRASDANLARRIEDLREEVAQLKAAPAAEEPSPDLAMLRRSIADIGAQMARLHRALAQDGANAAERLAELQSRAGRAAAE